MHGVAGRAASSASFVRGSFKKDGVVRGSGA